MIITATQKHTRQTARKLRYVADVVKKMPLEEALKQLAVIERRASLPILKTVRQAIANAMNNHQLAFADLKIKNIVIDEAPTYKRWRAVSRGRAHTILKRSAHIKVELETIEASVAAPKEEPKVAEKKVAPKKAVAKKVATKTAVKKSATKKVTKKIKE